MELLFSFVIGLLAGIVIAYFAFIKLTEASRGMLDVFKGGAKARGDWGEVVLERVLEVSGLQKGIHYHTQETYNNGDNSLLRPDVVVHLPDNRHVIIDSKAAFDKNTIKDHIKSLKNKFYEQIKDLNTPDFVIMFVPVEAVFVDVMRKSPDIFEFAWKNKVLLTSPSTLLAALKIIELTWQQENQAKNVVEIAEQGGKLYDKFADLIGDIEAMKNQLGKTAACLENMDKKLEGSRGLLQQVKKLKILGAKTSKSLQEKYSTK